MNLEMEYNTQRPKMSIPEYGRSVQKMIDYACTVEDRAERTKIAKSIIKVMEQLAPHLRDLEEFEHKLWAHLYIMSEFKLDVDSPYGMPSPESFFSRPDVVPYPQSRIRYGHYGKTIQLLIAKASAMDDGDEKKAFTREIGNLMKRMYLTWNRDTVSDEVIIQHLQELSGNKLQLQDASELQSTADLLRQRPTAQPVSQNTGGQHRKKRRNGQNRNKKRF
jgi:hypothetical protein